MRMAITITTDLTIRIILDAIIRSSDVEYNGGTIRSRLATYSRIRDYDLRKYLPVLVEQGLISQETMVAGQQNNPRHASRMSDKNRANASKTIYRVTDKGYQWLRQQEKSHYDRRLVAERVNK